MGKFDTVTVDYPLPDAPESTVFQTHGLGCHMDQYTVTKEGRLILHIPEMEWVEDDNQIGGHYTTVSYEDQDMNYHGDLFIHSRGRVYRLRFTDGVVTHVRRERE